MNIQQAKQFLLQGFTLQHTSFLQDEYIYQKDALYFTEEGYQVECDEFWKLRSSENFNEGWTIINAREQDAANILKNTKALQNTQQYRQWIRKDKVVMIQNPYCHDEKQPCIYPACIVVVENPQEDDEDHTFNITRFFFVGRKIYVSVDYTAISISELCEVLMKQYSNPLT